MDTGFDHDSALVRQKSINSLQSIFMLEHRFFNWKSEESRRLLQCLSLKISDENMQIGKAAAHCLISLCRVDGVKSTASMLSIGYLQKLKDFLESTMTKLQNS